MPLKLAKCLALHLPLVPPGAPVAQVEGLVGEHEGAERLLPRGKVASAHSQRARADEWAEHGVVLAKLV